MQLIKTILNELNDPSGTFLIVIVPMIIKNFRLIGLDSEEIEETTKPDGTKIKKHTKKYK